MMSDTKTEIKCKHLPIKSADFEHIKDGERFYFCFAVGRALALTYCTSVKPTLK